MIEAVRLGCAATGLGCAFLAVSTVGGAAPGWPGRAWVRALDAAGGAVSDVPPLRRRGGDAELAQRLAVAGAVWPARWAWCDSVQSCEAAGRRMAGLRVILLAIVMAGGVALVAGLGSAGVPIAIGMIAASAVATDWALAAGVRSFRVTIEAQLPVTVEMISGMLTAGVPLDRALAMVALAVPSQQLSAVLTRVAARARGGVSASEAFRVEAQRTGLSPLTTLAAAIERAHHQGLPVQQALSSLALDLSNRAQVVRTVRAGRTGPYAALITAVVIAPACVGILLTFVVGGFFATGIPGIG